MLMLQSWQRSLWWKQRNRVKLQRCDDSLMPQPQSQSPFEPQPQPQPVRHRWKSRNWSPSMSTSLRLVIFSLLLSAAAAIVDDDIPVLFNKRGSIIASREAVGTPMNISSKQTNVCEIPPGTSASFFIITCCDATLTFNFNGSYRYDQGREHMLLLPPVSARRNLQLQIKEPNRMCTTIALCYAGLLGNALPDDTSLNVFFSQSWLQLTWMRSQRDASGDFTYEVVVWSSLEKVNDGCGLSRLLSPQSSEQRAIKAADSLPQDLVVKKQTTCDSVRTCTANIYLGRSSLVSNQYYYVNVFLNFHGVRMSYKASRFCNGYECADSDTDTTAATAKQTTRSSTTKSTTQTVTIRPDRGKLYAQFADVLLSEIRQVRTRTAFVATVALNVSQKTRKIGSQVAVFLYSCTNNTRGTISVESRGLYGKTNVGSQARRYSGFMISLRPKYTEYVQLSYVPKRANLSDLPLLRLNAIYFDNASRNSLPPLANRTLLKLQATSNGKDLCQLDVSFSLNCSAMNAHCSPTNNKNVYYRLVKAPRHSRVLSCVPASSSTGRPLGSQALKLLPISQRGEKKNAKRNPRVPVTAAAAVAPWSYRSLTYQGTVRVDLARGSQRRYFIQLFWRVISTDSYIPFSEATFRMEPNCQIPVGVKQTQDRLRIA